MTRLVRCALCAALLHACVIDAPIAVVSDAAATDASTDAPVSIDVSPSDSGAPDGPVVSACTAAEIDPIMSCGRDECGLVGGGSALSTCLATRCALQVVRAPDTCRDCLQRGVSGTLDEVRALCGP
ncbi:MAG: hypothetical protein GXP55_08910 [Deltaproteobacteria bacterium]|nr:hypothetical protein [Deltaproteobacteria bacterium]